MERPESAGDFWARFLRETGRPADTPCLEMFHFDLTERGAETLLELVLQGKKRATASAAQSFSAQGLPLPQPGALSVVLHWDGRPGCVIRTERVVCLPFREVPFALARLEGEDETLEDWQRSHARFFRAEGARLGYAFTPDVTVVFEKFEVVYPI